jgi:hypothetical protein
MPNTPQDLNALYRLAGEQCHGRSSGPQFWCVAPGSQGRYRPDEDGPFG